MPMVDVPKRKKIVIIGGIASSLWRFRGQLISDLVQMGHEVICLAGENDAPSNDKILELGASLQFYPLNRKGKNMLQDIRTLVGIAQILQSIKPDVLLTYTVKPVIWGGIAGRILRVPSQYSLITGLGQQFSGTSKLGLSTKLLSTLYSFATQSSDRVVFQNDDDLKQFVQLKIVSEEKTAKVNGSGVDLNEYTQASLPKEPFTVLMVSRLLIKKGVREYLAACAEIKKKYPEVRCLLIGMGDQSPAGLPTEEVESLKSSKSVEFLGSSDDVSNWLKKSHLFVLPSYYGEGVPRTILEALATGRAVVTTDNVGCRDAVVDGECGFLVPTQSVERLTNAIEKLIVNPGLLEEFSNNARSRAEKIYDVKLVNKSMIEIMGLA